MLSLKLLIGMRWKEDLKRVNNKLILHNQFLPNPFCSYSFSLLRIVPVFSENDAQVK